MKYIRLASKRGLGKWHTLWLGDDHLLAVESTGYSEEYTRYYLKDIQALIARRSTWGMVLNVIFGLVVVISLITVYVGYKGGLTPESISAGIFGGVFLPILLRNLFRGPTCRCHIRSFVGIEELPALDRVRSVKKVLARLHPLTGQLQGNLSREEIAALTSAAMETPSVVSPHTPVAKVNPSASPIAKNMVSPYRGTFHQASFLLLIVEACISILQFFYNSKLLTTISAFILLGFLLLVIAALIKQREHRVDSMARKLPWCGLATMVSASVIESVFMMIYGFDRLKNGKMTSQELKDLSVAIKPLEHPPLACFRLLYILIIAGIGIVGLISIGKERGIGGRRQS